MVEDMTDTRKELNTPVYEANKPIYGSDSDVELDEEDYDDEDEGRDYLYDDDDMDDDYDMDETDRDDDVLVDLAIRNYVENKLEEGDKPTLNQITGLRICKNSNVTCKELMLKLDRLGFVVEDVDDSPLYRLRVIA